MQPHAGSDNVADIAGLQASRCFVEPRQQFVGLEGAQQAAAFRRRPFGVLARQGGKVTAVSDFPQHALGFGLPLPHVAVRSTLR